MYNIWNWRPFPSSSEIVMPTTLAANQNDSNSLVELAVVKWSNYG